MLRKIKKIITLILSMPNTIYFNFRTFNFRSALLFPVIIKYNVKVLETHKNAIVLTEWKNRHYRIKYGFGGSKHISANRQSILSIGKKGIIYFSGMAEFAEGCSIRCDYGKLSFGNNFSANKNCCFNCEYEMKIGDNVLLGWNVNFRDTDGHAIYVNDKKSINQKKIIIGNHVWICSYVDILKGVEIGNDSVIAWRSNVIKPITTNNCLIGGSPAKILKENVKWSK